MNNEITIRDVFRKFQPEEPVFVLSVDKDGNTNGMVAGWNTKCSHEPARFAVCLSKKCNTKDLIRESKEFVIAMPNKSLEKEVNYFGSVSGKEFNKFEESGIKTKNAEFVKVPILEDATINLECKLFQEIDMGDHIMFVGDVLKWHVTWDKKTLVYLGKDDKENREYVEY